jgi:hypothetical protein
MRRRVRDHRRRAATTSGNWLVIVEPGAPADERGPPT